LADHLEEVDSPLAGDPHAVAQVGLILEHGITALARRLAVPALRGRDLPTRWVQYHAPVFLQVRVDENGTGRVTRVVIVDDPSSFVPAFDQNGRPIVLGPTFESVQPDEPLLDGTHSAADLAGDRGRWPERRGMFGGPAYRSGPDPRTAPPG
jgi:hypothetical protein